MTKRLTTEEFIERAKAVHGERWDYSKTCYKNQYVSVELGCAKHVVFLQSPSAHVYQRQGCPTCGREQSDVNRRKRQDYFLKRLPDKIKETYDFTATSYAGIDVPVEVGCSLHGIFTQRPHDLYKGVGCPSCAVFGFKPNIPAHFYVLKSSSGTVKVGITNRQPKIRAKRISASSGEAYEVVYSKYFNCGVDARRLELEILTNLRKTYKSPINVFDGRTESFIGLSVEALIDKIETLLEVIK